MNRVLLAGTYTRSSVCGAKGFSVRYEFTMSRPEEFQLKENGENGGEKAKQKIGE